MDFFTLVGLGACFYFFTYVVFLGFADCDLQLAFFEKFGQKAVKLRGKVIWVTGASTALGQRMALEVANHGGKLALSSNSPGGLQTVKALCLNTNPLLRSKDVLVFHFDVGEINSHRAAVMKVLQHFGTVDVLILNEDKWETGIWENTSLSKDRLLFQSNLFGVLSLCRLVVRYFNLNQKGTLAVASSIAGLIGIPYSSCYSGAKHALHGYFDSLRYEKMGENIQTTLLCVGSSKLFREKTTGNDEVSPRKKMSAERCAHLCLTAIVNDLDEAWMAVFPGLPLIYGIKYFPNITKSLLKYLKPKSKPDHTPAASETFKETSKRWSTLKAKSARGDSPFPGKIQSCS